MFVLELRARVRDRRTEGRTVKTRNVAYIKQAHNEYRPTRLF